MTNILTKGDLGEPLMVLRLLRPNDMVEACAHKFVHSLSFRSCLLKYLTYVIP